MAYIKNDWQRGDKVTSEKLNNIENGIADLDKKTTLIIKEFNVLKVGDSLPRSFSKNDLTDKTTQSSGYVLGVGNSEEMLLKYTPGETSFGGWIVVGSAYQIDHYFDYNESIDTLTLKDGFDFFIEEIVLFETNDSKLQYGVTIELTPQEVYNKIKQQITPVEKVVLKVGDLLPRSFSKKDLDNPTLESKYYIIRDNNDGVIGALYYSPSITSYGGWHIDGGPEISVVFEYDEVTETLTIPEGLIIKISDIMYSSTIPCSEIVLETTKVTIQEILDRLIKLENGN